MPRTYILWSITSGSSGVHSFVSKVFAFPGGSLPARSSRVSADSRR